ncbi:conserved hypothetical protein [Pyrenophora tritici-repentis Pt-1C-BFP]|uniref:Uncharacterized protein n=1 Tax=Pyrenophora tritici-repentis (strain Pt-1C-BFP) TaxID=426418 RepID=B2W3W5_PYRTR|nr:uncharacterized protein PTRG_05165 [Pyrenophora tritici-repentis Pt-1C-BFP]EDU48072.1 conserved hypothetical protein [Pyrenophora tritici-repentis Pt-1C-BFP]
MPRDPSGVPHTGTLGLFDDVDELATSTALTTSHELHRLKGQIRRLERHDISEARRQYREDGREVRRDNRNAKKEKGKGKEGWWKSIFSTKTPKTAREFAESERLQSTYEKEDGEDSEPDNRQKNIQYRIVRRPTTPEAPWKAEDVQSVDSIWLQECGMVRVRNSREEEEAEVDTGRRR